VERGERRGGERNSNSLFSPHKKIFLAKQNEKFFCGF